MQRLVCAIFLVSSLLVTSSGSAINITMNFASSLSASPNYDSDRQGLINIFNYTKAYYEDIFQDAHNITINYWYEDIDSICSDCDSTTLGLESSISHGGSPRRTTEANIRIDTDPSSQWFIDSTPSNNSEFKMQQTLWRDISGTEQLAFYNNFNASQVPQTFEVAYKGKAVAGSAASGKIDMLNVVLHEVGHALGMDGSFAQTNDGDYDFNPSFVFGKTLAADVANGGSDEAHLSNTSAIMNPYSSAGTRILPSHTDLFSMASTHQYTNLDVPRREFYGGSTWNSNANWSGNKMPEGTDEVFVRLGGTNTINFSENTSAGTIHVEYATQQFAIGSSRALTANGAVYVDRNGTLKVLSGILHATNQLRVGETYGTAISDGLFEMQAGSTVIVRDNTTTALLVGNYGYATFNQLGGVLDVLPQAGFSTTHAYFGNQLGSSGTYNLFGGNATFSNNVYIGNLGQGAVEQRNDAWGVIHGDLILGNGVDGIGTYDKQGDGSTQVDGALVVGNSGDAVFWVYSGNVFVNNIKIADNSTSDSSLTVNGGVVTSYAAITIGLAGAGRMTVNGGQLSSTTGSLTLGRLAGGIGTFNAWGGTTSIAQTIVVGQEGEGTLEIHGNSVVNGRALSLGRGPNAKGIVTQDGGHLELIAGVFLGDFAGVTTNSTFTKSSGTLTVGENFRVGDRSSATFTQTGGSTIAGRVNTATDVVVGLNAGATGKLVLSGGSFTSRSDLTIGSSGKGVVEQSGDAYVQINGDLTIASAENSTGTYNLSGGVLDVSQGTIQFGVGIQREFTFTGGTLHVGEYKGNLLNNGGSLAPQDDNYIAGLTKITGDYTQLAGSLEIELGEALGETIRGVSYDAVDIGGLATLGGLLRPSLLSGFVPDSTDTFSILSAASIMGSFANELPGRRIPIDGLGSFQLTVLPDSINGGYDLWLDDFLAAPPRPPGDFDSDGDVDGRDFLAWQRNPGIGDLADWHTNYGTQALSATTAVPEPASLILAAFGIIGFSALNTSCRR